LHSIFFFSIYSEKTQKKNEDKNSPSSRFWTGRQQLTIDGTLLFVEEKRFANFLANLHLDKDHRTTSIQGDRQQFPRKEALQ